MSKINAKNVIKNTQEQASAAWIDYLNQLRFNELIRKLSECDVNLEAALKELSKIKEFISDPSKILGSEQTKHGEIAEQMQVHISNARDIIKGNKTHYTFDGVHRLAAEDYLKDGEAIQSKYCHEAKNTFNAIKAHLDKYSDFIENGGTYEIPKDQYEHIIEIMEKKPSELTRSEATLKKIIEEFEKKNNVSFKDVIKPGVTNYSDVQINKANETVDKEAEDIKQKDKENRDKAYDESKPSFGEAVKVTAVTAAVEGGTTFLTALLSKLRNGKKINEFTSDDWEELGIDTAKGTGKGAVRGATIYVLTNFTATPSNVASAIVTASFGILQQAKLFNQNKIEDDEFIENSIVICMDATVSAISALAGSAIPIPILGTIIGTVVGNILYEIVKQYCGKREQELISKFKEEIESYKYNLEAEYQEFVNNIEEKIREYDSLLTFAFDKQVEIAFVASIELAVYSNIDENKILHNINDIDNYFLN